MLAVIGNKSLKIFCKALKFLAKYSSEYIIEAKADKLLIKTCSLSQVSLAFASFDELFFVKYEISENQGNNFCRISAKVLLTVLKNSKLIASCTLKLDVSKDCMYVNIHKHNDIIVKNKISLLEFDQLEEFTVPDNLSEVVYRPALFRKVLQSSRGIDELEFEFKNDAVNIQSYIDHPDEDCETIRLNYTIDVNEFSQYMLKEEKSLIASCDDFVILLNLAQVLNMEISTKFSVPGRPIISKLKNDINLSIMLIQATLPPRSISRRNIRNHSYKQVVLDYVEQRKMSIGEDREFTDSEVQRAINPNIVFSSSNLARPNNNNHVSESGRSSPPTYVSTPSNELRENSKRKNFDESVQNREANESLHDISLKRRRTTLGSTFIGNNTSIVLSQNEINEVNDIMSNIGMLNDEEEIEITQQPCQSNSENNENVLSNIEENVIANEDYASSYSRQRWPLQNSFFGNSELVEEGNVYARVIKDRNIARNARGDPIQTLFGHIFRPKSKTQFGKVLVPCSDSESSDEME